MQGLVYGHMVLGIMDTASLHMRYTHGVDKMFQF